MPRSQAIGKTPLIELTRFAQRHGVPDGVRLLAKLESANPSGSIKDRAAHYIIKEGIEDGSIQLPTATSPGTLLIEPTSGNTGIGLAAACAELGLRFICVMPASMSAERRAAVLLYGGKVVLTPGDEGMPGAIRIATELQERLGAEARIAGQFDNPANPRAHYETTGPEIAAAVAEQYPGCRIAAFLAGVGTGGTLTGTGRFLLERFSDSPPRIVALEPAESPVMSGGQMAPHGIMGIGPGLIPANTDMSIVSEIVTVTTPEALAASRELMATEGIMAGISSGANVLGAARYAAANAQPGEAVVTVICDTGDRYLSTALASAAFEEATKLSVYHSGKEVEI